MAGPRLYATERAFGGSTTTPKTASIKINAGDLIVLVGTAEDGVNTFSTPTNDGAALTWTSRANLGQAAVSARVQCWTAVADTTRTLTVTLARSAGTGAYGFVMRVWTDGATYGGVATSTDPDTTNPWTFNITTTAANSAIQLGIGDWSAIIGVGTYNTATAGAVVEDVEDILATKYGWRHAYYPDAGTAAAKTVGLTAPAGQTLGIIAVEIKKGTAFVPAGYILNEDGTRMVDEGDGSLIVE